MQKEQLLRGAAAICEVLGPTWKPRHVYHAFETGSLPIIKVGGVICARASTLVAHIEQKEREALEAAEKKRKEREQAA